MPEIKDVVQFGLPVLFALGILLLVRHRMKELRAEEEEYSYLVPKRELR